MQEIANPFTNLPIDPNTGVPIVSVGPGASSAPTAGGGSEPTPQANPAPPTQTPTPQAGAPSGTPQGPEPDLSQPGFDEGFVDAKGIPGDIRKYQAISDPAQQKAAVEADGLKYEDFKNVTAPKGVSGGSVGEAPVDTTTPEQTEQMYQQFSRDATISTLHQGKGFGSFGDVAASFNEDFIRNALNPVLTAANKIAVAGGTGEAVMGATMGGNQELANRLTQMGLDYIRDPARSSVDATEMFDRLGIKHDYPDTYMGDAGKLVWSTIATSLAMMYGGAAIENAQKARGIATYAGRPITAAGRMIVQKYNQIVRENPGMWLTSELLGSVGATAGGEKASDYAESQGASPAARQMAELGGSISGGIAGAGVGAYITVKVGNGVMRMSKMLARGIVQTVDNIQHLATGRNIGTISAIGRPGPAVQVDQTALDIARRVETKARAAGDEVVEARKALDKAQRGTQAFDDALARMALAKSEDKRMSAAATRAWNMIPAEVRGKYSRQQTAIRDKFADQVNTRSFAQQQVQGEELAIATATNDAILRISPADKAKGVAGSSAELSKTLWKLREQAKGVLSKYWQRANLDRVMPKGIPYQKALDGFVDNLHEMGYDDKHVPLDTIARWRDRFSPASIKDGGRPSLAWYKQQLTDMQEEAKKAYLRGDTSLGANYDRMYGMAMNLLAQAFPDDVPLQQARAVSKKYFDLFTRSELGQLFKMSRAGGPDVHEEDTFKTLINRARGFNDLRRAVDWLDKKGIVNIKDPDYVTKGQRDNIQALQTEATQALKAHVSDYINKNMGDIAKAAKMLGDPAFQRQIQALGKVKGDMQQAAQDFTALVKRRQALEDSAMAKYAQGDADKAIDTVWNSRDPSATATALIDGTVGIGGFRKDPMAMSGFEAGLLKRFQAATKGDPDKMKQMLSTTRGRLLRTVLGDARFNRLENLVNRMGTVIEEQAKQKATREYKTLLAQYAALKVLAHLPEIFEVGEGGSLKRASLVSGFTKDYIEGLVRDIPPENMLKEALDNPEYEHELYASLPFDRESGKEAARTMRRAAGYERGIWGYFDNFMTYGDGPGPTAEPSPSPDHMGGISNYFIGSANAATSDMGQGPEKGFDLRKQHIYRDQKDFYDNLNGTNAPGKEINPGSPILDEELGPRMGHPPGNQRDLRGVQLGPKPNDEPPPQKPRGPFPTHPSDEPMPKPREPFPRGIHSSNPMRLAGDVLQGPMPQSPSAVLNARSGGARGFNSLMQNKELPGNVVPHPRLEAIVRGAREAR